VTRTVVIRPRFARALARLAPSVERERRRAVARTIAALATAVELPAVQDTEALMPPIARRPDGLTIAERHPSRQAARKQGWDPDHLPSVDYVIGATTRPRTDSPGDGGTGTGHKMTVRTNVTPHWTHQPYGPRSSLRRVQWVPLHWRGPEGAPISVHATRIRPKK